MDDRFDELLNEYIEKSGIKQAIRFGIEYGVQYGVEYGVKYGIQYGKKYGEITVEDLPEVKANKKIKEMEISLKELIKKEEIEFRVKTILKFQKISHSTLEQTIEELEIEEPYRTLCLQEIQKQQK